jgi:valyl-tRNA synthetase
MLVFLFDNLLGAITDGIPGRDINLEILRVEGYRKFCNKIFNATKFAMLKLDETFKSEPTPKVCLSRLRNENKIVNFLTFPSSGNKQPTGNESLVEKWILHKLNIATAETNKQLSERNFMAATNAVYNFWLYELCDVYIVRPSSFRVLELAG